MSKLDYKIALVGPTRVGKTSLVSSILSQAESVLAGTPASMVADGITSTRISDNVNDLEGALAHGTFEPGVIRSSTSEMSVYELAFKVAKTRLPLNILDYPGGWLTKPGPEWEKCAEWISHSGVLIIPVDAVVAMEAITNKEQSACRHRLNIDQVIRAARDWTKARCELGTEGEIIIVPVKCETYLGASARKLYHRVIDELYAGLFDMLRDELIGRDLITVHYVPVATMGCVDLVDSDWQMADDEKLECHATFRVLPPGKRKVEGARDILILIARMIAQTQNAKERNFFAELWRFLNGEGKALREELAKLRDLPLSQRACEVKFQRKT